MRSRTTEMLICSQGSDASTRSEETGQVNAPLGGRRMHADLRQLVLEDSLERRGVRRNGRKVPILGAYPARAGPIRSQRNTHLDKAASGKVRQRTG